MSIYRNRHGTDLLADGVEEDHKYDIPFGIIVGWRALGRFSRMETCCVVVNVIASQSVD